MNKQLETIFSHPDIRFSEVSRVIVALLIILIAIKEGPSLRDKFDLTSQLGTISYLANNPYSYPEDKFETMMMEEFNSKLSELRNSIKLFQDIEPNESIRADLYHASWMFDEIQEESMIIIDSNLVVSEKKNDVQRIENLLGRMNLFLRFVQHINDQLDTKAFYEFVLSIIEIISAFLARRLILILITQDETKSKELRL